MGSPFKLRLMLRSENFYTKKMIRAFIKRGKISFKVTLALCLFALLSALILTSGFWWPSSLDLKQIDYSNSLDLSHPELENFNLLKGPQVHSRIIWNNDKLKNKTDYAFVYLHGYSASPDEINPTIENLARLYNSNAYLQRLTGHGYKDESKMMDGNAKDWLDDTKSAYEMGLKLGKQVVLVGTSTGASLALILAAQKIIHPTAMVLISPNFRPQNSLSWLMNGPLGSFLTQIILGHDYHWQPKNPEMKNAWSTNYPSQSLVEMMRLIKFLDETNLKNIEIPTLVLYTSHDNVVSVEKIKSKFMEIGSLQKQIIESSSRNHVLSGKYTSTETTDETVNYIQKFLSHYIIN
jgi:esterase/lipase